MVYSDDFRIPDGAPYMDQLSFGVGFGCVPYYIEWLYPSFSLTEAMTD